MCDQGMVCNSHSLHGYGRIVLFEQARRAWSALMSPMLHPDSLDILPHRKSYKGCTLIYCQSLACETEVRPSGLPKNIGPLVAVWRCSALSISCCALGEGGNANSAVSLAAD